MANMFGFPYFKECPDIHIPGGKEDTGTVLLTSDQKNFGIHADKQTVLQIRRSQLHTTNFYYRDRLRQDIPVVFHFFLGAGRESRYQNSVGIPVSLEIISFCTA